MEQHELVCISCPVGCLLSVKLAGDDVLVTGNQCKLGELYGKKEVVDPRRIVTTSITVYNDNQTAHQQLSVKTAGDIPKAQMFNCVALIKQVKLQGDVQVGDVVVSNILNLGVDVVATRSISF